MRAACVNRRDAELAIRALKASGLLSPLHKPLKVGDKVCLPIASEEAFELLASKGVLAEPSELELPEAPRRSSWRDLSPEVPRPVFVGDIAVFNWKREVSREAYVQTAEALMREMPRVKVALLKAETWGELRAQRVEHLAGEQRTRTVHKEYGLSFVVDLAKAYFNPRLAGEHRRVAEEVREGERVLDMFAGVGGFALHIASLARSKVLATDLNIEAVKLLAENVRLNRKRLKGEVIAVRADASLLPYYLRPSFDRIIMDHPTASRRFVGEACALAAGEARVHYYVLSVSCREASEEAADGFSKSCRRASVESCREVLEYSPSHSVYCVELSVIGY
ncbi:MAG: class I SAM-dependent methyltransferase family protein [Acidilobaceae archaeon]|nr:class I SAM-dependent methyltransferase family protein [Acidilobaceae archaeon]